MTHERSAFSAADSALGYIYQCRYALLLALQRLPLGEPFQVSIETLDDVVFERQGAATELLQTKHHLERQANLTDASPDLWKTLRIWIEQSAKRELPTETLFFLITTAPIPDGAAAGYLKLGSRNELTALQRLKQTAQTSQSKENRAGYDAFLGHPENQLLAILRSIVIIGSASNVTAIENDLRNAVFYAVRSQFLEPFLSRLEGWWLRRAIQHLSADSVKPILSEELNAQINDLREQFKLDALPIDEDILDIEWDEAAAESAVFVQQLHLISIGRPRIRSAIRDYYRAYEQRSRWLRDKLLYIGDISRYEKRLVEEWELQFERFRDQLGDAAAEDAKKRAAHDVYAWVETYVNPIRPNVTQEYICRGSYHILADDLKVGWHCDFKERLAHLLEGKEVA
jgi:hypothetical protein